MNFFKHRDSRFVLFSMLAHVLLVVFLFMYLKEKDEPLEVSRDVEINLIEEPFLKENISPNKKNQNNEKPKNLKKSLKKKVGDKIALKDLMPTNTFSKKDIFENARRAKRLEDEIVIEDLSFYREIWKALDAKFYYPDIFNALFIKGQVSTNIYIRHDGSLSRYVLDVESANEDVEWFIRSIVVEALHKPLHPKFWLKKKAGDGDEIKLRLNFDIEMLLFPEGQDNYSKGHVNRRELFFHRKLFNPKANAVSKALPFLAGPGQVDVVYIFNALSGRLKKIYERNMKTLKNFREANKRAYNKRRH